MGFLLEEHVDVTLHIVIELLEEDVYIFNLVIELIKELSLHLSNNRRLQ